MTRRNGPQDSDRMPTLSELIAERRDRDGVSIQGMARESGGRLAPQTIDQWVLGEVSQFPRSAVVFEAFADVLYTSVEFVVLAMAAQLGVPVRRVGSDPPVPGVSALTHDQLAALRALVRSITRAETPQLRVAADTRAPAQRPRRERR